MANSLKSLHGLDKIKRRRHFIGLLGMVKEGKSVLILNIKSLRVFLKSSTYVMKSERQDTNLGSIRALIVQQEIGTASVQISLTFPENDDNCAIRLCNRVTV